MEIESVQILFNNEIRMELNKSENESVLMLLEYLNFIVDFHSLFRSNNLIEYKISLAIKTKQWIIDWNNEQQDRDKFIKKELFEDIIIILQSLIDLLTTYSHININTCSLFTLMVKHFFSCIQSKCKNPSAFEYNNIVRLCWFQLLTITQDNLLFSFKEKKSANVPII